MQLWNRLNLWRFFCYWFMEGSIAFDEVPKSRHIVYYLRPQFPGFTRHHRKLFGKIWIIHSENTTKDSKFWQPDHCNALTDGGFRSFVWSASEKTHSRILRALYHARNNQCFIWLVFVFVWVECASLMFSHNTVS